VLEVLGVDVEGLEERLVEELGQRLVHRALAQRGHELLGVLLEVAERLPQEWEGHHPLPLLDQVQVGRRDAQVARRIGLLHVTLEAQRPELEPDAGVEGTFVHRRRHSL